MEMLDIEDGLVLSAVVCFRHPQHTLRPLGDGSVCRPQATGGRGNHSRSRQPSAHIQGLFWATLMALCLQAGVKVQIERRWVDAFRHVLGAAAFMLQPTYEEWAGSIKGYASQRRQNLNINIIIRRLSAA